MGKQNYQTFKTLDKPKMETYRTIYSSLMSRLNQQTDFGMSTNKLFLIISGGIIAVGSLIAAFYEKAAYSFLTLMLIIVGLSILGIFVNYFWLCAIKRQHYWHKKWHEYLAIVEKEIRDVANDSESSSLKIFENLAGNKENSLKAHDIYKKLAYMFLYIFIGILIIALSLIFCKLINFKVMVKILSHFIGVFKSFLFNIQSNC